MESFYGYQVVYRASHVPAIEHERKFRSLVSKAIKREKRPLVSRSFIGNIEKGRLT